MKKIQFASKSLTRIILSMLALCLTYKGCYTVSEEIQSVLEVTKNSMDFTYSGAEDNFDVNSNFKWTVTKDASWITVNPSSGSDNKKVTVVAEPNTNANTEPRTATITVSNGIPDKTRTINVTQNSPSLSLSESSLSFSNNSETKSFTISSNTSWIVNNTSSWLSISPPSGSNDGTITVTATNNSSENKRETTISVSGGGITKTISVTQEASYLTVSPLSLSFSSSGEQKTFTITSNTSWTVSSNPSSWLTITPTSGSNDRTVTVTASANSSTSQRTAIITVSGGGITRTITVTQEAPNLTVSLSSLSFSSSSEQKTFSVTSNTSWTVSRGSASWLTVSPSSGSNNGTITVSAASNTSTSQRTATITVSGGGITRNINVAQTGVAPLVEPEMTFVQGGTFTMGCTSEQGGDCYSNETPSHQVTLSDFYIGKFEVTQGLWKAVMGNNPSNFQRGDNYPVEQVSWNDIVGTSGAKMVIKNITYYANGFIYKLNQATGKQYRLPTEAEWEYAARGGRRSNRYKYSGSNTVGNVAWYWDNSDNRTHAVGGKSANELGIYDMSGNVHEWCSDWFGNYSSNAQTDPTGPSTGSYRVGRGGSWVSPARLVRASFRDVDVPGARGRGLGFRLARSSN